MSERGAAAPLLAAIAAAGLLLAACGDEDSSGGGDRKSAELLPPPTRPAEKDCAVQRLRTSAAPDDLAPRSGSYSFEIDGRREVLGENARTDPLPARATVGVSPERRAGKLRCFTVQYRLSDALAESTTFVVRGGDLYVSAVQTLSGGQLTRVDPEPPILALSGADTEWSGSFAGATRGSYSAEAVGRRTVLIGSERVPVVGIRTEQRFAGEVEGTDSSVQWISTDDNLVVDQRVRQTRTFGLDRLRLSYRARLTSRAPRGGP